MPPTAQSNAGVLAPAKFRAYGYQPPGHLWRDAQRLWRDVRMRAGGPPVDSSPVRQQVLGLNRGQAWPSHQSEGGKLRRKQ